MMLLRLLAALCLARAASAAAVPATPAVPAAPAVPASTSTAAAPAAPASPAVPATPPSLSVSLTAPAPGARLSGTVALNARARPGDVVGVQFQLDGADFGPRISSRPFAAVWNTAGTPDGPHLLAAVVFDRSGRSSSSDAVPVTVDNAPLLIGEIAVSGITATGATIAWTTSKPAEGRIEYGPTASYGSSTVLEGAGSTSHAAALTGLTPGTTYHFRADAASAQGAVQSDDATFETPAVSSGGVPPTVAIMNPAPGASVAGTVSAAANASGHAAIASVQFMADGSDLGPPVTSPPFVFSWNTASVADGPHALGAVAVDAAGNSATAVVNVNVANAPPAISGLAIGGLGPDRADVLWTTDQRADSAVDYGTSTAYGASTPVAAAQSTGHGVPLRGLLPGTQYHCRARSRNAAGVPAASDDLTFTTPGAAPSAAPGTPVPATVPDLSAAKSAQKFLTPATADGINDKAVFGPAAREVTIFDIRGRKVFHGTSSAPGSPVVWDCKDGSGRVVEAGVYLAKIVARDSTTTYQSFAVAK